MELTLKVESHMGILKVGYSLACNYCTRAKVTSTLAYYSIELITTVESFIVLVQMSSSTLTFQTRLKIFTLNKHSSLLGVTQTLAPSLFRGHIFSRV
jgi:hypothetical protein